MSSRILQQDSSLLLTEANEPLVNDNFISADGFTTGSTAVQTSAIAQVQVLQADSLTTTPVVGTSGITQVHSVILLAVETGSPALAQSAVTQAHTLSSGLIVTAQPVVPSVDIVEDETSDIANVLFGNPSVGQTSVSQNHSLSSANVRTSNPRLGTADDPSKIIGQEIKEIQQMFGGWQRRAYEVPDGRLVQAEREIQKYLGDVVSVDKKAKSLIKFGKSAPLATGGLQTIWTLGGNESYLSSNGITHVCSSSASDVYEIYLEGHTVTGSGQDQQFTFVTQTVTLQGQTPVALPTPLARCSMMTNNNGTEFVGRITVFEDTPVVGGVPSDVTKIHDQIEAGFQQSFKAATTFSDSDYYILTGGFGSVSLKQDAAVDFYLEVREAGKVFIQRAAISATTGGPWQVELDPAVVIPKNADIRITCETSTQGAVVFGVFKGYLAQVVA